MRARLALLSLAAVLLGVVLVATPGVRPDQATTPAPAITTAADQAEAIPPEPTPSEEPEVVAVLPEPVVEDVPEPVITEVIVPAALAERLDARRTVTPLNPGATVGIAVVDADGVPIYEFAADSALLPASTQKLYLAAGALGRLGGDFRFRTDVVATGPLGDGVLDGDLVILGGMDPALATPAFAQHVNPQRPRTPLEALADQVSAAGIARISGNVLGEASILPHEPDAPGWLDGYFGRGDTTRSSGLTVDAGRRIFQENGRWASLPAEDPAVEAADALHGLLVERGIQIDGGAGRATGRPAGGIVLGTVESPPLLDLLRYTVQRSDNHFADTIFRAVGRVDGDGSWTSGATGLAAALAPLDLDLSAAVFADGSGLSRTDRTSARSLVSLDARMSASSAGPQWRSLMAVSGESGTLRRRLVGTVAERRLLGKTGSLRDVRSLSGVVDGPDGTRYHFAVIGNGLDRDGIEAVRALQDDLVLELAEDLYGCQLVPVATPEPPEIPVEAPVIELELVCAR